MAAALTCFSATPAPKPASDSETPATPVPVKAKAKSVKIFFRDGLRFDPPRFEAKPGEDISIEFNNEDSSDQQHNFVLLAPGKLQEIVQAALALGEKGMAQSFVPASPFILQKTPLVGAEKKAFLNFTVPAEKGIYPYVCTFPGHGLVMYGALYVGVTMPPLDKDPNIPPTAQNDGLAGGGKRPFVQRMFLPNAGPAAIGVALPNDLNACWDAGQCRLRYVWKGGFLNAAAYWAGNGKELAQLKGDVVWTAPDLLPIRSTGTAKKAGPAAPKFLGYRLIKRLPEFHYIADEKDVYESLGVDAAGKFTLHCRIPNAKGAFSFSVPNTPQGTWTSSAGKMDKDILKLTAAEAADFTLTLQVK